MLPILQRGDNTNVGVVMIRSSEEQLILLFKERINDRAKRVSFLEFKKQIYSFSLYRHFPVATDDILQTLTICSTA